MSVVEQAEDQMPLELPVVVDLQRQLAEARAQLARERERATHAERRAAALEETTRRAWSLAFESPGRKRLGDAPAVSG